MQPATFWENLLRVVAVLGLLAILLLGAWGIIQLAFMIPSFFSGIGGSFRQPAAETVSVSLPATITAGTPFALNWRHTNKDGEYSYSVSYACASGLSVAAPTPAGTYQEVPCNTPFNFVAASSTMPLVAILKDTKNASSTFAVVASKLSTGAITASGSGATTVGGTVAQTPAPATSTPKPKPATSSAPQSTYYQSGRTSNLYGLPDLSVRILSARAVGGNASVQFEVSNVGSNATPASWSFAAVLPIGNSYTYPSGPQQKLYPGDRIVYTLQYSAGLSYNSNAFNTPCTMPTSYYGTTYTLPYQSNTGFTQPCGAPMPGTCNQYGPCAVQGYNNYYPYNSYGYGPVSLQLDPYNQVSETNKQNNYATATVY